MTQAPNDALDLTSQHEYSMNMMRTFYDDGDNDNEEYEEKKEEDLDNDDGNGHCKDDDDDDDKSSFHPLIKFLAGAKWRPESHPNSYFTSSDILLLLKGLSMFFTRLC